MKKNLLFIGLAIVLFFTDAQSQSQSQGFNAPDTAEVMPSSMCLACPGSSWMPEMDATSEDANYAVGYMSRNGFCWQSSCYFTRALVARDFGFTVPTNATIKGIEVKITRMTDTANTVMDTVVQLMLNQNLIGQNNYHTGFWPVVAASEFYGDSLALWGLSTITPADVNDPDFGVYIKSQNKDSLYPKQAKIDYVAMKVYYTTPALSVANSSTQALSVSAYEHSLIVSSGTTNELLDIQLYSVVGQLVYTASNITVSAGVSKISVPAHIPNGVYVVKVKTRTGGEVVKKVNVY